MLQLNAVAKLAIIFVKFQQFKLYMLRNIHEGSWQLSVWFIELKVRNSVLKAFSKFSFVIPTKKSSRDHE